MPAGYSFSKAHSASYAVESFQSLYLKAHYPLEFYVAVINNFGGFYQTWLYLKKQSKRLSSPPLFESKPRNFKLPEFEHDSLKDAYDEIELLGFPVSMNNFDMLQTRFRGEIQSKDLGRKTGQTVRMAGRQVTTKYVWTVSKKIMQFGTFIDYTGEFFDTVHFPASLKLYPFRGPGIYLIKGKVVEEFGFPSLKVEKMAKLPYKSLHPVHP